MKTNKQQTQVISETAVLNYCDSKLLRIYEINKRLDSFLLGLGGMN